MGLAEIDGNKVGTLARLKRTDFAVYPQGPSRVYRGHFYDLPRAQDSRVHVIYFMKQSAGSHLREHIQSIVAGRAVRSQPDGYPPLKHGRDRRRAGSQFHVAYRIMADLYSPLFINIQVVFAKPDAMGRDHAGR